MDRCRYLMRLCRRQNKHDMRRRLFQRFQQRVKSFCRQHMHFIDNIYFITPVDRRKHDFFTQVTDLIDTAVRGSVDLKHIHTAAVIDPLAVGALVTGISSRPLLTIQSFRQNLRRTGLACTSWAGK